MKGLMRYFKNFTPLVIIGGVVVLLGVAFWYLPLELWALAYPFWGIGGVLVLVGLALRVSDASYLAYFTGKVDAARSGRRLDAEPDYVANEFSFDGNSYARLSSAQKPVSEKYVSTELYIGKKELVTDSCYVDLAENTATSEKHSFDRASVTASVEERELRVNGSLKKLSLMTLSDGETSFTFPVKYNDIEVDTLVAKINDKSRL